jgi:uncharacterized protein YjdB
MMKTLARSVTSLAALTSLALVSCGKDSTAPEPVVPEPVVTSLQFSQTTAALGSIGRSVTFSATARDASGNTMPLPALVWSTTSASVATVDQAGKVVAVGDGATTIRATFGSITATAAVTVTASIDIRVFVSAMTNGSLVPANDTATVRVTVTGQ